MKIIYLLFACICLNYSCFSQNNESFDKFCHILGQIESNNNDFAVGDNGKAIGRYQIWRVCYLDAKEFNKNIRFSYESLTNKENSKIILKSYLMRYEPKALKNNDWEVLAKCWNGGCGWRKANEQKKKNLETYWKKVLTELNK